MLIKPKSAFHPRKKSVISRWEITHSLQEIYILKKKKKNQRWNRAGRFPILGLFPIALMQSCGFFPPSGRFWLCEAAQLAPERAAEQQQPPATSCCSAGPRSPWALLQPGQEWAALGGSCATPLHGSSAGGGEHVEEHFLSSRGRWKRALNGENVSGVLCSHKTHWMSQYQDCTEFKGGENKWKSRMTEGSIRSDAPKIWETSGKNVSHTSQQWVLVKKDTVLAPDSNWVWYLWCI